METIDSNNHFQSLYIGQGIIELITKSPIEKACKKNKVLKLECELF